MKKLLLTLFVAMLAGVSFAQPLSGDKMIPGDYNTIAEAVDDLNLNGVDSPGVTFLVESDYLEEITAPLTITATGYAGAPIVFQKNGGGANPVITRTDGGSLNTTSFGAAGDAIIRMEGTDYITFDGISLTANQQGIEYGYLTHKPSGTNGCQNVTIKNAIVTMNRGTSGMVIGIYIGNGSVSTTSATGVSVTSLDGRNANILITGNTVLGSHSALVFRGSSASGFADNNITIGASGEGNLLENYGGGNNSSAHGVYMIYATNVNISYNTFNNSGGGGSPHTSTLYGVFLSSGVVGDIVMNNNDITLANTAASSTSQGIYSTNAATSYAVHNNTFSSGTITSTGTLYLIYLSSSCQNVNVSGNQINGSFERSSASGTMYCYYNNGSPSAGTENIFNNNFSNITVSGSATFYGIYSSTLAAHTANIYNNVVSNINAGTGTVYGIYGSISNTRSIYKNTVNGFNNSGIIYGIYVSGGDPGLVFDNEVYSLTSASSSSTTTQMVNGIYVAGGTNTYIYNNYIWDLNMPNSPLAAAVGGICINSGTNIGVYYNTIFLNATGSASTFGTSGVFVRGTSSACDLRNNIIVNKSTPGETGYTVGIRWAAAFNPTYYASTSNNNNIYAGEPDANHLIYFNGTAGDQTMEDYQLRVSPMDAASFSEDPPFISPTAPYDLHLSTTVSTQCESGGIAVTSPIAIDDDFDGEIRQGSAGYIGTGTAPDVGAHEFEGIPAFTCGTPNPGNTIASKSVLCAGESVALSLENPITGTGNSFQWQSSPDGIAYIDIPDAVAISYTTTPVEEFFYRCVVVCQNGPETAYSVPVQVTFASHITSVTPGTRCGIGTVDLAAVGESGVVNWYDAPYGGNLLATGNEYTTPVITETTTYYAADVSELLNESGGKPAPVVTTSGTTPSAYGLVFTAFRPFTLNSFDVYPFTATAGNIVVELRSNTGATLMTSAPIPIPGGDGVTPYTVNIGWNIPVGEGFRILILSGGPSMVRESSGNTYPYPIGTVGTITSGYISGTSNSYYYMYNWNVTAFCESPTVPVVATVTPAPEIAVTATPSEICEGQSSVLLATSTNDPAYSYNWEPGPLVGATHIVTPLASQVYGVTATDNSSGPNDGCVAIGSVEVIVHLLPPATIVTPDAAEVENGNTLMLTASGGGSTASGQIGTGTSGTTTSTPYKGVWGGSKNQVIYTADELTAIGMKPGSLITAISFNATAFTPPYTYLGFTIAMKNTATSVMTTTAETGVTTVFGPVDYEVTETGAFTITHTLDIPFAWDGTSNLLVETCFNNNDAGTTSKSVSVQYTATTGFSRTLYISKDNNPTLCTEPPTGSTTTTRPNIVIHHELIFPKTWTPFTYLYSDAGATIPYAGEAAASVYTKPMTSITYTATSTTPAGCISSANAVITSCPAAPANLAAVNVTSEGFDLSWSSSQGLYVDAVVYTVDVATDDQFTNPVTGSPFVVTDPVLQVTVGGLTANTMYYFRVNAEGECVSSYSSGSVLTCPAAPANLGFSGITTDAFTAGWDPVTGAAFYTVEVCTDAGFTAPIAGSPFTVADPLVTLDVVGLSGNTTYYVRVSANSLCSSEFTSGSVVTCPGVPGGLAYSNATPGSFDLSWIYPAGGTALGLTYTVEVATDAGFLNHVAGSPFTVIDPVVTQTVSGLSGNTIYYVRVKAQHSCAGDWSSIMAYTCPDTPADLTLSDLTYTSFNLSWSSSAGGGQFPVTYEADIATDAGFLSPIAGSPFTITDPDVSLSVSGLISTYTYYYRVKAIGNCSSPYASGSTSTPGCDEPSALAGTPTSGNTANLSWTAAVIAPPLGYEWEVRTSGAPGSGAPGLVAFGLTNDTFDQVTGLTASTGYYAYVRSHCDPTTYSGWISATFTTLTCPIASIPYLDDFEAYTPPAYGCLTVVDANEDAVTWFTNTGPVTSGTKKMTILKAITPNVMNDWVYTQGLPLEAGHVYTVNFWYRAISPSYMESLKVNYGMAPDPSAMSATPIFDNPAFNTNTYTLGIAYITPTVDGIYWIGFHCYSGSNKAGIYIDDLAVCEGPYIAEPITGPDVICKPESGVSYSIPAILGATNYVWSVPSGATIVGGSGTNAITVDFSVSAVSGNITVYGENPCGVGNTATLAVTVNGQLPVSVEVVADHNPVCAGTEVLFTANPTNGGIYPAYQWYLNSVEITGATENTYSYVPADGDIIKCELTSDESCTSGNPAMSNEVVMIINPLPVVSSASIQSALDPLGPWSPVSGTLGGGYSLCIDPAVANYYLDIDQFDVTPALLADHLNGFTLDVSDLPPNWLSYWSGRGVNGPSGNPYPWQDQMWQIINGNAPIFYIYQTGGDYQLIDGLTYQIGGGMTPLRLPGDYPQWGYTYSGTVTDVHNCISSFFDVFLEVHTIPEMTGADLTYSLTPTGPWEPLSGDLETGYSICVDPGIPFYYLDISSVTVSQPLEDGFLNPFTVKQDNLPPTWLSYWAGRGVNGPSGNLYPWQDQMWQIINGNAPIFYIYETSGDPQLIDGLTYQMGGGITPLRISGDYPQWDYSYSGTVMDEHYCVSSFFDVFMEINTVPGVNPISGQSYCNGETTSEVILTSDVPGTTFTWENSNTAIGLAAGGTGNVPSFTATNPGSTAITGTITVTPESNGCIGSPVSLFDFTINPTITVSVTIAADANDVCAGTAVQFTATPVNGGVNPAYQWTVNNIEVVGATNATYTYSPVDDDEVRCVMTSDETLCVEGNPATSDPVVMIVNPLLPVSVIIAADADPVCAGTTVTYTATPTNGGGSPSYKWFVNTVEMVGFTTAAYSYVPVNGDQVYCILTSSEVCQSGGPATSNTLTATVNPLLPVSVSIEADQDDVCAGTTVTFTATPVNGGMTPGYQWFVNSVEKTGFNTDTYSYVPANGDQVYCILTSSEVCQSGGPATSNTLTAKINPLLPVSVSILADQDEVCAGTTVTFTATPVNGGSAPTYQWFVNLVEMTGFNTDTYSYVPEDDDQVYCILTSSETCQSGGPATSNTLTAIVNPLLPVSVTIVEDANPVCEGTTVTFTATPLNGGLAPSYQWFVNSVEMTGFNTDTYSYVPANGDQVYCVLTSNEACTSGNPATSNTVSMTVTPLDIVSVSIDASINPVCTGSPVLFTAYPVNAGTNPTYQWSVNGLEVEGATNITYEYIPVNGDQVFCTVTTYDPCITGSPAVSNTITMDVQEYVPVTVYIEPSGNPFCEGNLITFTAYAQNAGATPVYDWYVNSALMSSGPDATFTYLPVNFDEVYCVVTSSELCPTGNPATSDPVVLTIYPVLPVSVTIEATATEVCAGTTVTFTAYPVNGGLIPSYQWKLNDVDIIGATESTYTYKPANGDVITCVLESGLLCKSGDPATSNAISMTVNPLLLVNIVIAAYQNQTEVCEGTTVSFVSIAIFPGMFPQYQWQVNSTDIAGATSGTFSYVPANGDLVSCILTSSEACATNNPATSNSVGIVVNPILPVSVDITVDVNPVMIGTPVTFTPTPINGGTAPDYQWIVNGFAYGSGATFTYIPVNGDQVKCVLTSSEPCTSGDPATSNTITMNVLVVPVSVKIQNVTIAAPEVLCYNATELITVAGPPYTFVIEPGGSATMIAGVKINYLPGTLVKAGAYMHGYISNVFCDGVAPPITAAVTATEEVTVVIDRPAYTIFPNPTRGNFTIRQKGDVIRDNVQIEVYSMTGERIITDGMIGERQHEVVFSNIPDGIYFVRIISGSDVETVKLVKNR